MAQPAMDAVDMSKVQFRSYAFHFLLAAGKGCLLPFLSIYMRMLGLTAVQVGTVIGAGAWVTMISSTCLTHCATTCNKRRFMLVMSLLSLIISYMLLMVVPPINDEVALSFCSNSNRSSPAAKVNTVSTTLPALIESTTPFSTSSTASNISSSTLSTTEAESVEGTTALSEEHGAAGVVEPIEKSTTLLPLPSTTLVTKSPSTVPAVDKGENQKENDNKVTDIHDLFSEQDLQVLKDAGVDLEVVQGMSEEEIIEYLEQLVNTDDKEKNGPKKHHGHRTRRDTKQNDTVATSPEDEAAEEQGMLDSILSKFYSLQNQIKQLRKQVFAAVLVVVIAASLFGSPADKLADDTWFDFLDTTDMLEKYGQHKAWASLGLILIPVTVTIIVHHTECILPGGILNFKIHFFVFLALMLICFILSFVYPIVQERTKIQRLTRLSRGFRILFVDCHGTLFVLTVLVLGLLQAVPTVFVFWLVQDLGGSELVMGISITISAFSQLQMEILHRWLIRRLTHAAAVVLGLLILAGKLLIYSFSTSAWFVLVGEGLTGFSTGLVLAAITSYPDFRLNPFVMDRSALSVMNIIHTGFGVAAGSVVAGILYDRVGLQHVLQGGCVLAVTWALIFAVLCRCVPKKSKVRYAKLLQEDETTSDEESFDENDWLETALKHQK